MDSRDVYVKITINNGKTYTANDITEINIQRSITDGSFGIGYTQSDRLTFRVVAAEKLPQKTMMFVYVGIGDDEERPIGKFYADSCVRDGSVVEVIAYDAMYYQSKTHIKFTGNSSVGLDALSFPCSMQDMLDYICILRNFTCRFRCQNFTIEKLPQKPDGSYFTVRELFGFIAASHGCNAKINSAGELIFKRFSVSSKHITVSDATEFMLDDSEPYEVEGLFFTVDPDTAIYVDDDESKDYDPNEDNPKVVRCYNPLATVEIANYAWSQIGGCSYYGGSITQRGGSGIECGDIVTVGNLRYPVDSENYPMCVTDISYSITAESGFMEALSSQVIKEGGTSNGSAPTGGGSGNTKLPKITASPTRPALISEGDFLATVSGTTLSALKKLTSGEWINVPFEYGTNPSTLQTDQTYYGFFYNAELVAIFYRENGALSQVAPGTNSLYVNDLPIDVAAVGDYWLSIGNTTDRNLYMVQRVKQGISSPEWETLYNSAVPALYVQPTQPDSGYKVNAWWIQTAGVNDNTIVAVKQYVANTGWVTRCTPGSGGSGDLTINIDYAIVVDKGNVI